MLLEEGGGIVEGKGRTVVGTQIETFGYQLGKGSLVRRVDQKGHVALGNVRTTDTQILVATLRKGRTIVTTEIETELISRT